MKKKVFFRRLALTSFALAVVASPLTITGAVAQEKAGFTLRAPETRISCITIFTISSKYFDDH